MIKGLKLTCELRFYGSDICVPQLKVTTEVEHKIAAYKCQCVKHKEDDAFIVFKKQFTKSSERFLFIFFFSERKG